MLPPRRVRPLGRTLLLLSAVWSADGLTGGAGEARAQSIRTPPAASIDSVFAQYDSTTTPGCAVAVLHADSVILRKAYGMAHIGFGVPMTTATTTWIPYSESRVFIGLAVAMLARDAAISLDDPVQRHVPELPAYAAAVTVRHLVHHTSGLADYGVLDPGFDLTDRVSEGDVFRALARWGRLGFPAGAGQVYSNTDYALLKILVERVTGRSLHGYLHERVLRPLGMHATRIGADQGATAPSHSLFHEVADSAWRSVLRYRISPVGGISVTTNVDDLVRWARALRDSSTGIAALLASLEAGAPEAARDEGFMFGMYPAERDGVRLVEYRGVGEYKYLVRVPGADLSVVTVCNTYGNMWSFGPRVAALFAGRADSAEAVTPTTAATNAPTVAVPAAELQRYVGEYVQLNARETGVSVALADGALVFTSGAGSFPMRPIGAGRFEFGMPAAGLVHLTFAASDSTLGGLLVTGIDLATGESAGPPLRLKTAPQLPSAAALRAYAGTYVGDAVDATLHVTVAGDRLMVSTRGVEPTELVATETPDTFSVLIYTLRFERDAVGGVTHLVLDATRVKGMRYTRQAGP